ncbi:MAG: hypothetical protein JWQ12_331 [Glaciihabitans sp.]|nr:hypothetical protein [Glaciihabitans sp.]
MAGELVAIAIVAAVCAVLVGLALLAPHPPALTGQ